MIKALLLVLPFTLLGAPAAGAPDDPVIGQLKTRDHLIVIHTTPEGSLYTIKTHDGEVLVKERPLSWIALEMPELHRVLSRGVAIPDGDSASGQEKAETPPLLL